ncbi:MAG: hypothetical protein WBC40_03455 [Halobacteriota archaeon]
MSLADRDYMKKNYRHKTKNSSRFKGWNPHPSAYKRRNGNYINKSKNWFFRKKHPYSKLYPYRLMINSIKTIIACIILLFILSHSDIFYEIPILFVGFVMVVGVVVIYCLYKVFNNLRYGFRGLTNGAKLILVILLIVFSCQAYQVREDFISLNLLFIDDYIDDSPITGNIAITTPIPTPCTPFEIRCDSFGTGIEQCIRLVAE